MSVTQSRRNEPGEPPEICAFCDEDAYFEAELFTMGEYVDTNFGEKVRGYHIGICGYHFDELRSRYQKLDPDDLVISAK